MIVRSWVGVIALPTTCNAGTDGETPPLPFGPWHWAQANWLNVCAPSATSALTLLLPDVVVVATVTVTVVVLPQATRRRAAAARSGSRRNMARCYAGSAHGSLRETTALAVSGTRKSGAPRRLCVVRDAHGTAAANGK